MPTRAPTGRTGSTTARHHDPPADGSSLVSLPAQAQPFIRCFRCDDHPSIIIKISSTGETIERENFLRNFERGPLFQVDLVSGDASDKPGCEWIQGGIMYWLETSPNELHIEGNGLKGEAMHIYDGLLHIKDPTMGTMKWRAVSGSEVAATPKKEKKLTQFERENKLIFRDKLQIMRWFQANSSSTATGRSVTKVDVMRELFKNRESRGGETLQEIDQGFDLEDLLKDDYFAWDMFDGIAHEDAETAYDTSGVQGYMRESLSRLDWTELWEICGNGVGYRGMYKNRWRRAVRFATSVGCQRRRAAACSGRRKLYTDLEADDATESQSEAEQRDSESESEAADISVDPTSQVGRASVETSSLHSGSSSDLSQVAPSLPTSRAPTNVSDACARDGYAAQPSSPTGRSVQGNSSRGCCCVCLQAPSEFAFLHADATAHLALCSGCHLEAGINSCYICRQPATAIIKVHIS